MRRYALSTAHTGFGVPAAGTVFPFVPVGAAAP